MSVQLLAWAFDDSGAKGTDLLVLLALVNRADADGYGALPDEPTLSDTIGVDQHTVAEAIATFKRARLIEFGGTHSYRILPGEGPRA